MGAEERSAFPRSMLQDRLAADAGSLSLLPPVGRMEGRSCSSRTDVIGSGQDLGLKVRGYYQYLRSSGFEMRSRPGVAGAVPQTTL